jgi:DNA primase
MAKSSFIDFKAVKAAVTMEKVLEHYRLRDQFKQSGDSLSGPCPIHKGSNPTQFRVSLSKNIWNCFSECKHGGNSLDFIARMEKITIHAAALKAIEWFHLDRDAMSSDSGAQNTHENSETLKRTESKKVKPELKQETADENNTPNKALKFRLEKLDPDHTYLVERGIAQETIAEFDIGFCNKGMMAGRIAIPIHNSAGEVVAYAGRFPGEAPGDTPKYKLPPEFRKTLELFNIHRAIKHPEDMPLVIVEGFFGCMHLWQLGWYRVVALMGSTMSQGQEDLIQKHVSPKSQIILMLDEDNAGRAGRDIIAPRLAKFAFVKIHLFKQEGLQPEHLDSEDLDEILGGIQ